MGQIDYAKLAKQHGGTAVENAPPVDYAALARQNGGSADESSSLLGMAGDFGIGVAKGAGSTAFGVGKMLHDYTPVGRLTDAAAPGVFDERPEMLEPTNTAQRVGKTVEQIGEFFVPVGMVGKAAKAAELAKAGLLTLAQTDSPTTAGVATALTAALPKAGQLALRAGNALKEGAEKTVIQALGPTKEWAKSEAAKLAPEMLKRGVKGSRDAMLNQASGNVSSLGAQIDATVQAADAQGATVFGPMVVGAINRAKQSLTTPAASGTAVPIEGTQAAFKTLDRLEQFVASLGDDIPIAQANRIKQAWQKIVSKAGFYGPKATASATDNAKAWATREAEKAMRQQIANESPELAALNKEFAFWKGLKDVLTATELRKQGHGAGLTASIGGIAGAVSGVAQGDSPGGIVGQMLMGGIAGRQAIALMQSPQWRTMVAAPLKNKLADALLSGKTKNVQEAARIVVSSIPARLRPAPVADLIPAVAQEPDATAPLPTGQPR